MKSETKALKSRHGIRRRMLSVMLAAAMVLTLTPLGGANWVRAEETVSITLHFKNYANWAKVAAEAAEGEDWTDIAGYEKYNDWPGGELTGESDHRGYYTLTISKGTDSQFNCIFNDGVNGSGNQTANICISTETLNGNTSVEGWVIDSSGTVKYEAPASWSDSTASDLEYTSPEVSGNSVTFRYKAADAARVRLAGSMTSWETNAVEMTKGDDGIWSCTLTLAAGKWEYKFIVGDSTWETDPANSAISNGNSLVVVPGLAEPSLLSASIGVALTLPSTLDFYMEDGTSSAVIVSYNVKEAADSGYVTIADGKLTVADGYSKETLALVASDAAGNSVDVSVSVVSKLYTYTVYYYDSDETHQSVDATDLWIWTDGVDGIAYAFSETETLATQYDGATQDLVWLKGTVSVPYTAISMIPRSKGAWNWQKAQVEFTNSAAEDSCTIYLVAGKTTVYTSLPNLTTPRERYAVIDYERSASDYGGWNIYSWNTGLTDATELYGTVENGVDTILVPIEDYSADLNLAFCMRRSTAEDSWAEKDGGDHYLTIPADQTVVKAKFVQGQGITEVLPYNLGYEMDGDNGQIHFYYRDDSLFLAGETNALNGVQVVVNGTAYDMSYDSANERYSYTLTGIETGDYYYYYVVTDEENSETYLTDAFNGVTETYGGQECSMLTYKHFDNLGISASMYYSAMDPDDNNVVTLSFTGSAADQMTAGELRSAEIDLSALGLGVQSINTELMERTIACLTTTTAGSKTLPVKVTDIYGNTYQTTTSVTVTENTKSSGDFDWDEAIIYFAVTDRFFDGSSANNSGVNKDGTLSYHGGDFVGLTKKLDELQELGVNTIWITPIVENSDVTTEQDGTEIESTGYHGYWASDFTVLNSHLGTAEEFEALITEAHKRGMKLMVDVVINHAGYDTENYFNSIISGKDMIRTAENTVTGSDVYASLSGLPDFVTEDADVRAQLVEWQTEWMSKYDIDYYRVDTVKHVDSTTWAAFKNSLTKENQDFKLIGEYAGAGYANTAGELGTGSMDALLDFDFNDWAESFVSGGIESVESSLVSRNSSINNTATMGSFINSHDEDGLMVKLQENKGMTEDEAAELMKVAASLVLTAKGIPVIYYGEELGQYGEDNYPYQTNRYDYDWDLLETQKADSSSLYNHYKKLLEIRNAYTDVFARGSRTTLDASDADGFDVFSRSYGGTTLYIGMNTKQSAATVKIATGVSGTYQDLYSGIKYTTDSSGNVSVTIPAAADGGTVILVKEAGAGSSTSSSAGSSTGSSSSSAGTEAVSNKVVEVAEDGTVKETVTVSVTNTAGNEMTVTTVTKKDADGNLISTTEKSEITNIAENTSATVTVRSDAEGTVTSAKAAVTTATASNKTTLTGEVVSQITEAAGQTSVRITVTVRDMEGSTKYKYKADTADLTPGNELYIYKLNTKTSEYIMVNAKTYKVSDAGSVSVSMTKKATYELVDAEQAAKVNKAILKTVKVKKSTRTISKGKKATVAMSEKLNMENVKKITYTSSKKSVAAVNKNGKVTAKKSGTATVKAKVTLKNGMTKTVKMKIKVK